LMTLGPQSASRRTSVGLGRTRLNSSTVKRDRACEACGMGQHSSMDGGLGRVALGPHHRRKLGFYHAFERISGRRQSPSRFGHSVKRVVSRLNQEPEPIEAARPIDIPPWG
jgi:hypothetical protein